MLRVAIAVVSLLVAISAHAQNPPPASDPQAITLAQQSIAALTGGLPITDVTLNANVQSIFGSDSENGTATFSAKGTGESRVDLNLNGGTRSDVRNLVNGFPAGAWAKNGAPSTPYSGHNCWTDAAWFFPALSSLAQTANPNFIFKYVGQEQHGGVSTQHIQVFQIPSGLPAVPQLSTMDFYLDAASSLPVAIGFNVHPDDDMGRNIPAEIDFFNYQPVNGIQVPFHFQRLFNGSVVLDVAVTNTVLNSGLPDSLFELQ